MKPEVTYWEILQIVEKIWPHLGKDDESPNFFPDECPDDKRCAVTFDGKRFNVANEDETTDNPRIVVVLESPHKSEYSENGQPKKPASGTTGRKFDECLENFLALSHYHHECFTQGTYDVWIMNAVCNQVSLGLKPELCRSILFQISWHLFGESYFLERLGNTMREGSVLFNTCTIGNKGNNGIAQKIVSSAEWGKRLEGLNIQTNMCEVNLKKMVGDAIAGTEFAAFSGSHPSMWDKMLD